MSGTQPSEEENCQFCGSPIVDHVCEMSWSGKPAGGALYSGWCRTCNIRYVMTVGYQSYRWQLAAPDRSQLLEQVGQPELDQIAAKLNRYATVAPKWAAFLALKIDRDELWRYQHDERTAIAIVRNGVPVASFRTFSSV